MSDKNALPGSHKPLDDRSSSEDRPHVRAADRFATTRWSLVRTAGHEQGSAGRKALEALCESYWYPLYAFIRRRGFQAAESQDLTQAFFADLLERNVLAVAERERGRFRFFLLQSLKNFLSSERRKQTAEKRGAGRLVLSLDFEAGETRYRHEPVESITPERLFQRRWTLLLLEQVLEQLRTEYDDASRSELFAALEPQLQGRELPMNYAELGTRLGMSEGALKVAAHRLRRRYREILRARIAETVSTPEEIDEELRDLQIALSG
jgi:DNA-directed RNA polymerase specialized sigma24 family protein